MADNPTQYSPRPVLANNKQIGAAVSDATTPDGAEYLRERVAAMLSGRHSDMLAEVTRYQENLARDFEAVYDSTPVWKGAAAGTLPAPVDVAAQENTEKRESQHPETPVLPLRMAFSVNANALPNIGFLVDGQSPDDRTKARLKDLFLDFLATKRVALNEQNQLCQIDDLKRIQYDEKGNPRIADLTMLEARIQDENSGFSAFIDAHAHGLSLDEIKITMPKAGAKAQPSAPEEPEEKIMPE